MVAVTDANFKPERQVSDLETVMSKRPDIIVSLPTDPVATATAYQAARRGGAKDGGPFPTGTGINPTLTIMANAWRVAEHIAGGRDTTA